MKLPGGDRAFVPSIINLDPDEDKRQDMIGPPAPPTFSERLKGLFKNLGLKRFFRHEWKKSKYREARRHNPPGAKLIRRWVKNATGIKKPYDEALEFYSNLQEPALRAGASRFERARAKL